MEDGRAANRAEAESEPRALITGAHVFSRLTKNLVRRGEARQRREHTAGPLLTGETVAHADSSRFALDFDAQLTAMAGGCSGRHRLTSSDDLAGNRIDRTGVSPACQLNRGKFGVALHRLVSRPIEQARLQMLAC